MSAHLVSLNGRPCIHLNDALVLVGRHPKCDARVNSVLVSQQHCCLTLDDQGALVRDLGSTNGTWINGQIIARGRLRQGDVLSIAHYQYRLEVGGPQEEITEVETGRPRVGRRMA